MLLSRFAPLINQSLPPAGSQKLGWFPLAESMAVCICIFWSSAQFLSSHISFLEKETKEWLLGSAGTSEHKWFQGGFYPLGPYMSLSQCSHAQSCSPVSEEWCPGCLDFRSCICAEDQGQDLRSFPTSCSKAVCPGISVVTEGGERALCLPCKQSPSSSFGISPGSISHRTVRTLQQLLTANPTPLATSKAEDRARLPLCWCCSWEGCWWGERLECFSSARFSWWLCRVWSIPVSALLSVCLPSAAVYSGFLLAHWFMSSLQLPSVLSSWCFPSPHQCASQAVGMGLLPSNQSLFSPRSPQCIQPEYLVYFSVMGV